MNARYRSPAYGHLNSGEAVVQHGKLHLAQDVRKNLPAALAEIDGRNRPFIKEQVRFGHTLGMCICVPTTNEDAVVYAQRPHRRGLSRFVLGRVAQPSDTLTVVLKRETMGTYKLVTAFIGSASEPEPWDKNATPASADFWSTHAFVWGSMPVVSGTMVRSPLAVEEGLAVNGMHKNPVTPNIGSGRGATPSAEPKLKPKAPPKKRVTVRTAPSAPFGVVEAVDLVACLLEGTWWSEKTTENFKSIVKGLAHAEPVLAKVGPATVRQRLAACSSAEQQRVVLGYLRRFFKELKDGSWWIGRDPTARIDLEKIAVAKRRTRLIPKEPPPEPTDDDA